MAVLGLLVPNLLFALSELQATKDISVLVMPEILINEVSFKDEDADWVELFVVDDGNDGGGVVLDGFELKDDGVFKELDGVHVSSGDFVLVTFGGGEDESKYLYSDKKGLVATTEQVVLWGPDNEIIDAFCWVNDKPAKSELRDFEQLIYSKEWLGGSISDCFSSIGVAKNQSIVRSGQLDSNSVDDWSLVSVAEVESDEVQNDTRVEFVDDGDSEKSVGGNLLINEISSVSGSLVISELMPNPEGKDKGKEWIELQNISDSDLDLSGFVIDDEDGGSKPYALNGKIIAGGVWVLEEIDTGLQLGNTSDSVRLFGRDGRLIDEVTYEGARDGMSYSRFFVADEFVWEWTEDVTKGESNKSIFVIVGQIEKGVDEDSPYLFQIRTNVGELVDVSYKESLVPAGLAKITFEVGAKVELFVSEVDGGYELESFELLEQPGDLSDQEATFVWRVLVLLLGCIVLGFVYREKIKSFFGGFS